MDKSNDTRMRSGSGWSARTLLSWLVLACLMPGVVGAGLLLFQEHRTGRSQLEGNTIHTARALVQTVDTYLLRAQAVAETLAEDDSLAKGDFVRFRQHAQAVLDRTGLGTNILITDRTTQQVLNLRRQPGEPLPRRSIPDQMERVFTTGKPVVSNLYTGAILRHPLITIDVPVVIKGKIIYTLAIEILPSQFATILANQGLPSNWVMSIFDTTGTIIARTHNPERFVGQKGAPELVKELEESPEGVINSITREGFQVAAPFSRSPNSGWSVAIGIPRGTLEAPLTRALTLAALGVAALFGIGLVLASVIGRKISQAFQAIVSQVTALGAGKPVPMPTVDVAEAEEATRAIGLSAKLLEKRQAALRESEERFRLLADNIAQLAWMADRNGWIYWYNQRWYDYTGTTLEEMQGWGWQKVHHPDHVDQVTGKFKHHIETGEPWEDTLHLRGADGEYRWFLSRAIPKRDASGRVILWFGTNTDITDRMQAESEVLRLNTHLEDLVRQRTTELTVANQELEAFTFATSHDLRGPLGRINSFAMLLERNCRDVLEGDNLLFLSMIRQNATRLAQLVDDLLAHARVAQHSLELKPLNIAAATQAVVHEKVPETGAASVGVRMDLPPVRVLADSQALDQILGNLVENAIKYSSKVASPIVEIGGEHVGNRFRLWVKDNGVGFDLKYHDKIFKMFQRLHTYTEYQGSGIGLALVSRATERMGGKVWAESEPGKGATFFVELQLADA